MAPGKQRRNLSDQENNTLWLQLNHVVLVINAHGVELIQDVLPQQTVELNSEAPGSPSRSITETCCENMNWCAISRSTRKRKAFPTMPAPRFTGLVTCISALENDFALRIVLFAPVSTSSLTGVPSIFASTRINESTERNGSVTTRGWASACSGVKRGIKIIIEQGEQGRNIAALERIIKAPNNFGG